MKRTYTTTVLENHHLNDAYNEMSGIAEEQIYDFNFKSWFKVVLEDCMLTEYEENIVCVPSHQRDEDKF